MIQQCRYCRDFYRIDDNDHAIETADGWVRDICRQCQDGINIADAELYSAWQDFYEERFEENNDEGEPL